MRPEEVANLQQNAGATYASLRDQIDGGLVADLDQLDKMHDQLIDEARCRAEVHEQRTVELEANIGKFANSHQLSEIRYAETISELHATAQIKDEVVEALGAQLVRIKANARLSRESHELEVSGLKEALDAARKG